MHRNRTKSETNLNLSKKSVESSRPSKYHPNRTVKSKTRNVSSKRGRANKRDNVSSNKTDSNKIAIGSRSKENAPSKTVRCKTTAHRSNDRKNSVRRRVAIAGAAVVRVAPYPKK